MNDYAKEMRDRLHAAHAEIATLKAQNAELLAALDVASEDFWGHSLNAEARAVDKALAKARGDL